MFNYPYPALKKDVVTYTLSADGAHLWRMYPCSYRQGMIDDAQQSGSPNHPCTVDIVDDSGKLLWSGQSVKGEGPLKLVKDAKAVLPSQYHYSEFDALEKSLRTRMSQALREQAERIDYGADE